MIVAAASAALFLGTGVAEAETFTGRVTSKNPTANTVTIQTEAGQEMTVRTGDAAIRSEGATIALDRVQVGDRVRVEADAAAAETGTHRAATSVEVVTAAGATGGTGTVGATPDTGMPTADVDRGAGMPPDDATREPAPSGMERTELSEAGGPATEETETDMERRDNRMARLPDTAGPFPLIGLLGATALAGAIALRRTRS
jgi:hypothetical protein